MSVKLTFYYDYLCPFACRLALLLDDPDVTGSTDIKVNWKAFSLEQQNSKKGPDFKLWEHPEFPARGVKALAASKAAANQGEELFGKFHYQIFRLRHDKHQNIADDSLLAAAAENTGLEMNRFEKDMKDPATWESVGRDHQEGKEIHNLFGVPTLIFETGKPVYVKISELPVSGSDKRTLFELIVDMAVRHPCLMELKRPDMKIL